MLTMYRSRRNTSQPDALGDGPVVGARRRVARDRFLWIFHRVARREFQKSGRRDRAVVIRYQRRRRRDAPLRAGRRRVAALEHAQVQGTALYDCAGALRDFIMRFRGCEPPERAP